MIVDRRALQIKERIEASMVRKKMCNSPFPLPPPPPQALLLEILYYFKPFDTKIMTRQVDYFLFLLVVSSKYNFFHLFLIAVVNLVRKQLLRFYGD